MQLPYRDAVTFVVTEPSGYGADRTVDNEATVNVIFLQNTGQQQGAFRDFKDSDAVLYADPDDSFIINNYYRLEGMYVKAALFDASENISWFKVIDVTINRDHLLDNKIDNVVVSLKKTRPIPTVS